jgi:hypothetical protein
MNQGRRGRGTEIEVEDISKTEERGRQYGIVGRRERPGRRSRGEEYEDNIYRP